MYKEDRQETDGVGDQGNDTGRQEFLDRLTRTMHRGAARHLLQGCNAMRQPVIRRMAAKFFLHSPGADFLHTMADTNGENQEGRQDIHWIQAVAQQAQDTHLPDNCYQ